MRHVTVLVIAATSRSGACRRHHEVHRSAGSCRMLPCAGLEALVEELPQPFRAIQCHNGNGIVTTAQLRAEGLERISGEQLAAGAEDGECNAVLKGLVQAGGTVYCSVRSSRCGTCVSQSPKEYQALVASLCSNEQLGCATGRRTVQKDA